MASASSEPKQTEARGGVNGDGGGDEDRDGGLEADAKQTTVSRADADGGGEREVELPAAIKAFDEFTSPVKNPVRVFWLFNAVLVALVASLLALWALGENPVVVGVGVAWTLVLGLGVNAFLWRLQALVKEQEELREKARKAE